MCAIRQVEIAAATALAGALASGPLAAWLVAATHPQPPWRDAATFVRAYHAVQIAPYLAGFLLVGGFVGLIAGLHALAGEAQRARTACALGLAGAFAAMIFVNYALQTTLVPALVRSFSPADGPLLAALTMANPRSLGWALEMWGYAVLGAATWLCAPVFSRGRLERATRALFALNGPLSLLGALASVARPGWVTTPAGLAAYVGWNVLIVAMTALAMATMRGRGAAREASAADGEEDRP